MSVIKAIIIISVIAIVIAARKGYKEIKEDEEKLKQWKEERLPKDRAKSREEEAEEWEK